MFYEQTTTENFNFSSSPSKKSAKQGRRAADEATEDDNDGDMFASGRDLKNRPKTADILLLDDEAPRRPRASAPSRRTGGWSEETRLELN